MKNGIVIAIDGPAASGKGTIVALLTKHFKGINIYTGGMYRALVLFCNENGIPLQNTASVSNALSEIVIDAESTNEGGAKILLNEKDVTKEIRTPAAGIGAGIVSNIQEVRNAMVQKQREIAQKALSEGKIVIMDGQDIGTNVFPDANYKFFLTADVSERAKRRQKQYEKEGIKKNYEAVEEEIKERDQRDWSRNVNPLPKNPQSEGYIVIDSTHLNELETVDKILAHINL